MRHQRIVKSIGSAFLLIAFTVAHSPAAGELDAAGIFEATGVRGGLIVHVGCGDGRATASLLQGTSYLVQGLATRSEDVGAARRHMRTLGAPGRISVEHFDGRQLPYSDNTMNLLLIESGVKMPAEEVTRVLVPRGIVLFREATPGFDGWAMPAVKGWVAYRKPVPEEIDDWTHRSHGPDNNPAAADTQVGPPRHLQWDAAPDWAHHHQATRGIEMIVSARGKLFYLVSEGESSIGDTLPEKWALVARDAFNGVILWKKAVGRFDYGEKWSADAVPGKVVYPKQRKRQNRRLVAVGDRVYFTFGMDAPVSVLDAATGETIKVLDATKHCGEVVCFGDRLYVSIRDIAARETRNSIRALDPSTGKILWESQKYEGLPGYHPEHDRIALTIGNDCLFFLAKDQVVCLDLERGKELWQSAFADPKPHPDAKTEVVKPSISLTKLSTPSGLLYHGGRIYLLNQFMKPCLSSIDAKTGQTLWQSHRRPVSCGTTSLMMMARDRLWVFDGPTKLCGLDPLTGEARIEYDVTRAFEQVGGHIRCYPDKGTVDTVWTTIGGKAQQMVDLRDGSMYSMPWLRSGCRTGMLPCNGLSYITPNPCMCYAPVRLKGLLALSRDLGKPVVNTPPEVRLTRGPAYGRKFVKPSAQAQPGDWPTFRHDATRESKATTALPDKLKMAWETPLPGQVTQPVVAGGLVYVAATEDHTVYALDPRHGKQVWSFTTGGRIDSPPTWDAGRLIFGSADGAVYCLDSADGALAWRFDAAPGRRQVVSYNQVESLWPVHGTVLVYEGKALVIAGRTPYLDGGIHLYELNLSDGSVLRQTIIDMTGTDFPDDPPEGFLPDILVRKEGRVYSRYTEIRLETPQIEYVKGERGELTGPGKAEPYHQNRQFIVGSGGMLRDGLFHRSGMLYGTGHGQFMAVDGTSYLLKFFGTWQRQNARPFSPGRDKIELIAHDPGSRTNYWSQDLEIMSRSIALLDDVIVLGGSPCEIVPEDPWLNMEGRGEGRLEIRSRRDGSVLTQYKLSAAPVHNGVSVANRAVFMAMKSGAVQCWR